MYSVAWICFGALAGKPSNYEGRRTLSPNRRREFAPAAIQHKYLVYIF